MKNQTTLRDDGYLEINDPIVAACFLDKTVYFVAADSMTTDVLEWIGPTWFHGTVCEATHIRIPAATVAEVVQGGMFARLAILIGQSLQGLVDWLDKHAGEIWYGTHTEATDE